MLDGGKVYNNAQGGALPKALYRYASPQPKWQITFVMVFFTLLVVSVVLSCCSFCSDEKILFYYPGQ